MVWRLLSLVGGFTRGTPSDRGAAGRLAASVPWGTVSRGVSWWLLEETWLPKLGFDDEVVIDTADVEVSGCEMPKPLGADMLPEVALDPIPLSDPLFDAIELGAPPCLAELSEYILETDMRFELMSDMDALGRTAASGNGECFAESSTMFPEVNLGVPGSMAKSLLGLRSPCAQVSEKPPAVL